MLGTAGITVQQLWATACSVAPSVCSTPFSSEIEHMHTAASLLSAYGFGGSYPAARQRNYKGASLAMRTKVIFGAACQVQLKYARPSFVSSFVGDVGSNATMVIAQ